MAAPVDAVLLLGYGGPRTPAEVMPFLRQVTSGKDVPESRLEAVADHYRRVGGHSPFVERTRQLADALEHWLATRGWRLSVHLGMRHGQPALAETMAGLSADGRRHVAVVILAPHRSQVSWEQYRREAEAAGAEAGLAVSFLEPWFDDPRFLEANAARLEELGLCPEGIWPESVPVVFTAHSIPTAMAEAGTYVADLAATCEGIADILELPRWQVAYQSRSGRPDTPWLEPDINDVLPVLAGEGMQQVVVQAVGFLCDHVEVLYDLDIEARATADKHGLKLIRAACVQDHPEFVTLLGERLLQRAGGAA